MAMSSPVLETKSATASSQPMDPTKAILESQIPTSETASEFSVESKKCHTALNNLPKDERMPSSHGGDKNFPRNDLRETQASFDESVLLDITTRLQSITESAQTISLGEESTKSPSVSEAKPPLKTKSTGGTDANHAIGTRDGEHSRVVVTPENESSEPTAIELQPFPALLDTPDPRLLTALENPRDRLFVLKLEQDAINFILTPTREYMDTPPTNSYHRMLTHKIAEFYRLTHVSSTEATDVVRLYRGFAARIPPVKLVDITVTTKTPSETPPPGSQTAVKIMRRTPSGKGSEAGSEKSVNQKSTSDIQSGDSSKPVSREEREAAYQLARARIFGDFKETPPEAPSPSKTPQERPQPKPNRERPEDDGFQSRSQFVTIPSMYSAFEVHRPRGPQASPLPNFSPTPFASSHNTHSLNPSASSYVPAQPFQPLPSERIYPVTLPPQQMSSYHTSSSFHSSAGYASQPPHVSPSQPFQLPQYSYGRNFIPTPSPVQQMGLPPGPIYPLNSPASFTPPLNNRYPPVAQNAGPPPMANFTRPIPGFNRFYHDQSGPNGYPQPSMPVFNNIHGGWPMHDGNSFQS